MAWSLWRSLTPSTTTPALGASTPGVTAGGCLAALLCSTATSPVKQPWSTCTSSAVQTGRSARVTWLVPATVKVPVGLPAPGRVSAPVEGQRGSDSRVASPSLPLLAASRAQSASHVSTVRVRVCKSCVRRCACTRVSCQSCGCDSVPVLSVCLQQVCVRERRACGACAAGACVCV